MYVVMTEWDDPPMVAVFPDETSARQALVLEIARREPDATFDPRSVSSFMEWVARRGIQTNSKYVMQQIVDLDTIVLDEQWIGENGSWRLFEVAMDTKVAMGFDGGDRNTFIDIRPLAWEPQPMGDGVTYYLDVGSLPNDGSRHAMQRL